MSAQVVQREGGRVGHRVGGYGSVKQEAGRCLVHVDGIEKSGFKLHSGDVLAIMRQESVVG